MQDWYPNKEIEEVGAKYTGSPPLLNSHQKTLDFQQKNLDFRLTFEKNPFNISKKVVRNTI